MKKRLLSLGLVFLFIVLLFSPTLARAVYYYRRFYVPAPVPRPDLGKVDAPTAGAAEFEDVVARPSSGRVIIDRVHENAFQDTELGVLLARLTARGIDTAFNDPRDDTEGSWLEMLRAATGVVIVSPHKRFTDEEVQSLARFVDRGGRILLVADPSRYTYIKETDDLLGEVWVPQSDASVLNGVADSFGLAFADDYLYNTVDNAGNYQYVILRDFSPEPAGLTAGLEQVVFYSARSISTDQQTIIAAGERTVSSLSEQSGGLSTVSLGGDGRVLAVSDFTFMTEPYNATADNNRLIANIADFLAGAQRSFDLADFPRFFGAEVDLVALIDPTGREALPSEAIDLGSSMQRPFVEAGKHLQWQSKASGQRDTLYVGTYGALWSWPEVKEILAGQGITFTLETVEQELMTPTPTPRYTPTPRPTPRGSITPTSTPGPLRDWTYFSGLGPIDAQETALFYLGERDGHRVVIVLAFGEMNLASAVERLVDGRYDDCLVDGSMSDHGPLVNLAVCPTFYVPPVALTTPTPEPTSAGEPLPTLAAEGSLLVVSDDDGEAVYEWWTGAYDFAELANDAGYQATMWSVSTDGEVTLDQMHAYDAVIWCTGDHREEGTTPESADAANIEAYLAGGGRVVLTGAFIGDPESDRGLLLDVQVAQADHPLAAGFEPDQVIALQRFTADEDYETTLPNGMDEASAVFVRGPQSELAGRAAMVADEGTEERGRSLWIGFPVYLLPYEEEARLVTNVLHWLME